MIRLLVLVFVFFLPVKSWAVDPTLTGTPTAVTLTAGSADITVPSGTCAVVVTWSYYNAAAGNGLLSTTLETVSPNLVDELPTAATDRSATGYAIWFSPGTGAGQTLVMTFDAATTEGPAIIATYIKDCDTAAIRTSGHDSDEGATAVTLTLSGLTVGDLVVKFDTKFNSGGEPALSAGWTNGQTQLVNDHLARLSFIVAAGATQACDAEGENYSAVSCLAFKASGGAPPAGPPIGSLILMGVGR